MAGRLTSGQSSIIITWYLTRKNPFKYEMSKLGSLFGCRLYTCYLIMKFPCLVGSSSALLLSFTSLYLASKLSHFCMHCSGQNNICSIAKCACNLLKYLFFAGLGFSEQVLIFTHTFQLTKKRSGLLTSAVWPYHSLQQMMLRLSVVDLPQYLFN